MTSFASSWVPKWQNYELGRSCLEVCFVLFREQLIWASSSTSMEKEGRKELRLEFVIISSLHHLNCQPRKLSWFENKSSRGRLVCVPKPIFVTPDIIHVGILRMNKGGF